MLTNGKWMRFTRILTAVLVVWGICAFGDAQEFVKNGSFSDFLLDGGTAITNNGYIYRNTTINVVVDETSIAGMSIPGWYYVPTTSTTDHAAGINNSSVTTFIGSGNLPGSADYAAFVQRSGDFYTTLEGLTVGQTYNLSFDYNSRNTYTSYLGLAVTGDSGTPVLQQAPTAVVGNATSFYKGGYEFVADSENMELRFILNSTDASDRAIGLTNVSVTPAEMSGWGTFRSWNYDSDSRVVSGGLYTHAVNINGVNGTELNGVSFVALAAGPHAPEGITIGGSNVGPNAQTKSQDVDNNPASTEIMTNFVNNNPTITLSGLLPGVEYELLIMGSSYENANRRATLSVNDADARVFNEFGFVYGSNEEGFVNASSVAGGTGGFKTHEGCTLTWRGEADAQGNIKLSMEKVDNDTWHVYGIANRVVSLPENLIMATSFSGLNGENQGKHLVGMTLDYINYLGDNTWIGRGGDSSQARLYVGDGVLHSGANTGSAMAFDVDQTTGEVVISMDLKTDTLLGTEQNNARGVGLGFFDSKVGGVGSEVGIGFSGLVVSPAGELYFYNNGTYSEKVAFEGNDPLLTEDDFSSSEWYHLSMGVRFNGDGTAELTSILFNNDESTNIADYSDLLGSTFGTLEGNIDLIGFLTSGNGWGQLGQIDNFMVTNVVPEPATWVLMLLAAGGMIFLRRRTG